MKKPLQENPALNAPPLRLGVNIDHVATLRNARGGDLPDPIRAAHLAAAAGADGITAHLREDRRHIRDRDMERLKEEVDLPLNFEMAATAEMISICRAVKPHAACLVPENRMERTTEGGLDAAGQANALKSFIDALLEKDIRVSLFLDPEERQLEAAYRLGAPVVEIHTGAYHDLVIACDTKGIEAEYNRIVACAKMGAQMGIEMHAGHGLTFQNVQPIAGIAELRELNIGHFLISEALFMGLDNAIREMKQLMQDARTGMLV
jgi:pyridoxine 5-phosphate synthase